MYTLLWSVFFPLAPPHLCNPFLSLSNLLPSVQPWSDGILRYLKFLVVDKVLVVHQCSRRVGYHWRCFPRHPRYEWIGGTLWQRFYVFSFVDPIGCGCYFIEILIYSIEFRDFTGFLWIILYIELVYKKSTLICNLYTSSNRIYIC